MNNKTHLEKGNYYYHQQEYLLALQCYEQVDRRDGIFYYYLGDTYQKLGNYELAIASYQDGITTNPDSDFLYSELIWTLHICGYTEESRLIAQYAQTLFPQSGKLQWESGLLLPVIYESELEIDFYRDRFTKNLDHLIAKTKLITPEQIESAYHGAATYTNFYLQYQGRNDLELQVKYGNFLHQVMAAKFPQWVKPLTPLPINCSSLAISSRITPTTPSLTPAKPTRKIKVGYISHFFKWHTVFRVFHGFLEQADRNTFDIYTYYTDTVVDSSTEKIKSFSTYFRQIPHDLPALCQQIIADQLDILVFLDLSMSPISNQAAALRLAPIQCMLWGHPVTSGLPTIDYYLSSDLLEPNHAQSYYREQLIKLPNIGIYFPTPEPIKLVKTRRDYGLKEGAIAYLSCQSLFKYLPQYDFVFPAIAKRVPNAQFIFIAAASCTTPLVTQKFCQRLQRIFAEYGLDYQDYCLLLPGQIYADFQQLNLLADVFLDSFVWSGGMTSLDAINCLLPIVTCPGELMRGRQSAGFLKRMGITETIATDPAEYIQIATQLGLDSNYRQQIIMQMSEQRYLLYNDYACVKALELLYRNAITEKESGVFSLFSN